ncbi:dihydrofolate reductase family protein [Rubellicoccus peritrichatus]|uniref:Dihydrofolate reductase family protein n=1 Tax=Rubellicoccus peritrichatus TaxID=3080537 RepID=A0AAQ3L7M9_9BACT|nr:dihydrofolate reductase family protein [Puniceicoccus sp. CR14]WOO41129.1 dihydrofolate reductase family protein [Puniceicoccus sp. CR14]
MANYVYIATSLDGFIATIDGGIEWLEDAPNPDGSDFGFSEFISRVDALLMGRHTFEKVLSFGQWPYSVPVYVLSNTLGSVPNELKEKAEIISGSPSSVVSELGAKHYKNLYIDGGRLIQSFLQEDLIDELIVTRFPKLLGKGIPLFGDLNESIDFEHVETEVIENYLVKSRYRRAK